MARLARVGGGLRRISRSEEIKEKIGSAAGALMGGLERGRRRKNHTRHDFSAEARGRGGIHRATCIAWASTTSNSFIGTRGEISGGLAAATGMELPGVA